MPKLTIADLALELIAAERAVTTDQVVAAVLERKATRAKDPVKAVVRALENQPSLQRLSDGRWTSLLVLLDGMVLTHELSAVEAAAGALAVDTDLGALWTLVGYGTTRLLLDGEADARAAVLLGGRSTPGRPPVSARVRPPGAASSGRPRARSCTPAWRAEG